MAEKEAKGLFDTICQATKEALDERKRATNRKKLQQRIKAAYNDAEDQVTTAMENIETERQKIKDNYEGYSINVISDNVLKIFELTGVNFYTDKKQSDMPTYSYIVAQEYEKLFDESIDK